MAKMHENMSIDCDKLVSKIEGVHERDARINGGI